MPIHEIPFMHPFPTLLFSAAVADPIVFLGASVSFTASCVVSILVENQYYSGIFAGIILPTTKQDAS